MKTPVGLDARLPLTCSRAGACCHGNAVWLNPWELARLAAATGLAPAEFAARYTLDGGLRLAFDAPSRWRGLPACRLYGAEVGCTVHPARPLACRLFPLARERRGEAVAWTHAGDVLPCLASCPEVRALPALSVADYLAGQEVGPAVAAHDAYLELAQALADGAFVLLLDSGLAASGDRRTLRRWRALGAASPDDRARALPTAWRDRLLTPAVAVPLADPAAFVAAHHALLEAEAQSAFASLADRAALRDASALMMALSLHLGRALGADPVALAAHFIATAKAHGARD